MSDVKGALVVLLIPEDEKGSNDKLHVPFLLQQAGAKECHYQTNGLIPRFKQNHESYGRPFSTATYSKIVAIGERRPQEGRLELAKAASSLHYAVRRMQHLAASVPNPHSARGGAPPRPDRTAVLSPHFSFRESDVVVVDFTWLVHAQRSRGPNLKFNCPDAPGPFVIREAALALDPATPGPVLLPFTSKMREAAAEAKLPVPILPEDRRATDHGAGPSGRGESAKRPPREYSFGEGPSQAFLDRKRDRLLLPKSDWYMQAARKLTFREGRRVPNMDPRIERAEDALFCPRCNLWKGEWAFIEEDYVTGNALSFRGDHYAKCCLACRLNQARISKTGTIYLMRHLSDDTMAGPFYIGSTNKYIEARLTWHLITSFNPGASSTLYEYMRHKRLDHGGDLNWSIEALQEGVGCGPGQPRGLLSLHEQAWMLEFPRLHPHSLLLNEQRANKTDLGGKVQREEIEEGDARTFYNKGFCLRIDVLALEKSPDGKMVGVAESGKKR